jgi:hypothetical protein
MSGMGKMPITSIVSTKQYPGKTQGFFPTGFPPWKKTSEFPTPENSYTRPTKKETLGI